MNGCPTCGGWAGRHEPIAHDAEPDTPPAVCRVHKRFVPCRDDAEDCDISDHPADVEAVRRYQRDAEPQEDTVPEPTDELRADMIAALPGAHPWHEVVDALLPVVTAWADAHARERAAGALLAAAAELHVTRFNADEASELRWPSGAPRVTPDTFYRGVTVAESALKHRADVLTRPDPGRC